jgi:hypothetical protein
VIVECRRRTTSKLAQGSVGELAYRIIDTGASGGILVTSLGLQSGAKKVAGHSNIQHVILDPNSTTTEYVLRFLNRTFIGVAETCSVLLKESLTIEVIQDANVIEKRHYECTQQAIEPGAANSAVLKPGSTRLLCLAKCQP